MRDHLAIELSRDANHREQRVVADLWGTFRMREGPFRERMCRKGLMLHKLCKQFSVKLSAVVEVAY